MKRLFFCIFIGALLGCDVPANLRVAESSTSSIVGISLSVKLYNGILKEQSTVYFVKLDDKDKNNLGTKIIPCNYYRGTMLGGYYAYLVNAEPGTYAAIGSAKFETYKPGYNPMGVTKEDEHGYISFFDSDIVRQSKIDVGPGQIAFMGSFAVDAQIKSVYRNIEKNGDLVQQHYYMQLKPFLEGTYYCGAMKKTERSNKTMREYLTKSKDYFRGSEWLKIINKAIVDFDKSVEGQTL